MSLTRRTVYRTEQVLNEMFTITSDRCCSHLCGENNSLHLLLSQEKIECILDDKNAGAMP